MGSSGAGKTTLLNIISDQVPSSSTSQLEGDVMVNDEIKVTQDNFGSYAAYVTQDDYLYESFTCRKCIEFAAKLRLNLPKEQTDQRVDDIIESLNLKRCENTIIGNELVKGLSGGERKRTSIAVEMVTNPKIIFLDEPTSGLDSFTAHKIVSLLIEFASYGKTVISTIHQPSSDTFQLFPKLLLMMDGHTIYHGKAMESVEYFKNQGFAIPQYSNPADYFLKEFYVPFPKTKEQEDKINQLVASYDKQILPEVKDDMTKIDVTKITERELLEQMTKVNWFLEFWILLCRGMYNILYNPTLVKFKTIGFVAIGLACLA